MEEVLLLLLPLVIHTIAFLIVYAALEGLAWLGEKVLDAVRNYD